ACFKRDLVDGIRFALESCESCPGVRERVHPDPEPRDAIAAGNADQAKSQNDRQSDGNWLALDRRQHTEVENNDYRNENPQEQEKLALGDQIGLAGFIDQFRYLAHRAMHRKVLEPCINSQPEKKTKDAENDSD